MKIQIVGVGVVGSSQAYLLFNLGHEVVGYDHHKTSFEYAKMLPDVEKNVDITFVCTPEAYVPGVVQDLVVKQVKGLIVIKSTVPPGTTRSLIDKFKIHICHNPEFLREKFAYEDVLHPSSVVIGQCCPEHAALLHGLYEPLKCPIIVTRPEVSETVKVTFNSYLATLISFWNQIDQFAKAFKVSTSEVAEIVKLNPRVSGYGTEFFGVPFGGKCLPKDLNQLIEASRKVGLKPQLLEAVRDYNGTFNVHSL
jgi:nucleotide sugar dehydrogenase